jgi:hypothetical protein
LTSATFSTVPDTRHSFLFAGKADCDGSKHKCCLLGKAANKVCGRKAACDRAKASEKCDLPAQLTNGKTCDKAGKDPVV